MNIYSQEIVDAILQGEKNKVIMEEQFKIKLEKEKELQKIIIDEKARENKVKADKIIATIPKEITLAISNSINFIRICTVENRKNLEEDHYPIIFNALKEMGLNPYIDSQSGEDNNSEYTKYWNNYSICFEIPKLSKQQIEYLSTHPYSHPQSVKYNKY